MRQPDGKVFGKHEQSRGSTTFRVDPPTFRVDGPTFRVGSGAVSNVFGVLRAKISNGTECMPAFTGRAGSAVRGEKEQSVKMSAGSIAVRFSEPVGDGRKASKGKLSTKASQDRVRRVSVRAYNHLHKRFGGVGARVQAFLRTVPPGYDLDVITDDPGRVSLIYARNLQELTVPRRRAMLGDLVRYQGTDRGRQLVDVIRDIPILANFFFGENQPPFLKIKADGSLVDISQRGNNRHRRVGRGLNDLAKIGMQAFCIDVAGDEVCPLSPVDPCRRCGLCR